jgi:hypothetical protein
MPPVDRVALEPPSEITSVEAVSEVLQSGLGVPLPAGVEIGAAVYPCGSPM